MKKNITISCYFVFVCFQITQARVFRTEVADVISVSIDTTGVCIKGNVGVFGEDSLGMFGNVYLEDAHQVGDGVLVMCDTKPQLLTANNSTINNLYITNPTKVTLKGNLLIMKSLVVDSGVFDVRQGNLILSDYATLKIMHGGNLLQKHTPLISIKFDFQKRHHPPVTVGRGSTYEMALYRHCLSLRKHPTNQQNYFFATNKAIHHPPEFFLTF